jgi:hypothetical protein
VRLIVGIYYFVSTSSHWGDRGFVSGLGRGGASGYAFPGRAWKGNRGFVGGFGRGGASGYALPGRAWELGNEGMEGLLVGLGEAEPLDMRCQAEPGNEGF